MAEKPQHIIYNSFWLKDLLNYNFSNFILPPPTDYRYFDLGIDPIKNEYITLINLNKNKGGEIFEQIAKAMANKKFLGVIGSYDEQIIPKLPNVRIVEKSVNIKDYYAITRILVMPSEYESWGITATEAMSSGIPVICTETPGLLENCGKAAIYVKKRDDIKAWVKAISDLDDELDAMTDHRLKVELAKFCACQVATHHLLEVFAECCLLVEARRVATAPDAEAAVVLFVFNLSLKDESELLFFAVLGHSLFQLRDIDQHGLDRSVGFWMRSECRVLFFA